MTDLADTSRKPSIDSEPKDTSRSGEGHYGKPSVGLTTGQRAAAEPVAFGRCAGRYVAAAPYSSMPATAVLFAGPWGLEELSTRRFFRQLADDLADRGVASLRFDYPGTGDSLDLREAGEGLDAWRACVEEAAACLRLRGHRHIIIVGLGLGASLAVRAAPETDGLGAMALLAPVVSGRAYTRELAVWSKVVDDSLNLMPEDRSPSGTTAIGGLVMPPGVAAELSRLRLGKLEAVPSVPVLLMERPGQMGIDDLVSALEAGGATLRRMPFDGYDALITGPLTAQIPARALESLLQWIETVSNSVSAPALDSALVSPPVLPSLSGSGFRETGVRFGKGDRLAGVMCEPTGIAKGPSVLFFGSAFDRHSGWGRLTTQTARTLAAFGYASLRFDCANVGDSPPVPDGPAQVLYSTAQQDDAAEALTFLQTRCGGPVAGVGRCSGAYLAFRTGLADTRLSALVLVNPYAFVWDERRPLQEDLRAVPQSLDTYRRKLLSPATFLRMARGEMDVVQSARNLLATLAGKLEGLMVSRTGISLFRRAEHNAVMRSFAAYAKRRLPIRLIYSRGDVGTDHLHYHFGEDGGALATYGNVDVTFLAGADHNLTPATARETFTDIVVQTLQGLGTDRTG